MQTSIDLEFGDGVYIFRLPIKQIVAIEQKAGPIDAVKHRLVNGGFGIRDITEVIRHGLIGGGKGFVNGVDVTVSDLKANHLIDTYVDGCPIAPNETIARAAIFALWVGYTPPEPEKKSPVMPRRKSRARSTGGSSSTTAELSA